MVDGCPKIAAPRQGTAWRADSLVDERPYLGVEGLKGANTAGFGECLELLLYSEVLPLVAFHLNTSYLARRDQSHTAA